MLCHVATFALTISFPLRHIDWRKAAKIIFAIPPTSAASERVHVFSLLEAMFGKDRDAALSDLIQAALMLRYNKRSVG